MYGTDAPAQGQTTPLVPSRREWSALLSCRNNWKQIKALSSPLSKVHVFQQGGRQPDSGCGACWGSFPWRGQGEEAPLAPWSHPVCLERVEGSISLRWLPLTLQFGLLWSAEQGPGLSPRKCCSTESAYTLTNRVSLAIVCRCEGNRAFCRIIPV